MDRPCGAENARRIKTPSPSLSVEKTDIQSCTAERGGVPIPEVLMGFTKLDSGIIDSSIWSEALATRVVWITFLAKADSKGMVRASCSGMRRASNVNPEEFDSALKSLESPDPDSRSSEHEGRRIEKVEGGWLIFNYAKYRAFSYSGSEEAKRKRRWRDKMGHKRDMSRLSTDISASASVPSSISSSLQGNKKDKPPKIKLVLDEEPKRWEGITPELKMLWAKSYPGCDVDAVLQEMIAFWDAQPKSKRKLNWKMTIVNRLKWLQDHGGSSRGTSRGNPPGTWLKMMKEKEGKK